MGILGRIVIGGIWLALAVTTSALLLDSTLGYSSVGRSAPTPLPSYAVGQPGTGAPVDDVEVSAPRPMPGPGPQAGPR